MTTRAQVDAQFDRAVQVVQGMPKTGPIQTTYEDKLMMYSLYKQATIGNVQGTRPGIWDMLGRAKWDAWAKHKDLEPHEAKVLYVDSLLKVLRKYSDKTVARDLVREIESFAPGLARPRAGSGSSSGSSIISAQRSRLTVEALKEAQMDYSTEDDEGSDSSFDEPEHDNEAQDAARPLMPLPIMRQPPAPTQQRPHSSLSARQRTPLRSGLSGPGSSTYATPAQFPPAQPQPTFASPSAFSDTSPSRHHFAGPLRSAQSWGQPSNQGPLTNFPTPPPLHGTDYSAFAPTQLSPLELAVQALQAHTAALQERIDVLEHMLLSLSRSNTTGSPALSPPWVGRDRNPLGDDVSRWAAFDPTELGLWSAVARPVSSIFKLLSYILRLVLIPRTAGTGGESPSPALMVLRRLALDASFVALLVFTMKRGWRASGARRKDVRHALGMLVRAVIGGKQPRVMADKAV